jgi:uncharacterized ParB-like nuclease family protein/transposase
MQISISQIDFDSITQIRAEINDDTVSDYSERMAEGDKFPPVDLFDVGGRYLIGDGWHRILAYQKNGSMTTEATIHQGGRTAAIRFALGANAKHGMARSNADKRKAVEVALREFGNLSNREIARICGVGDKLVAAVRDQLRENRSSTNPPEPETRIGADGKKRKMPTPKEQPEQMPEETEESEGDSLEPVAALDKEPPKGKRLPPPIVDSAKGIWLLAKSQLDKIIPQDLSREAVLREVIEYAQNRLSNRK